MTPREARRIRSHAARTSYVERLAQVALVLVAAYVTWTVSAWVAPVLAPVLFSLLIAYFLDPVVDWFEERRISRTVAILVIATVALGALSAVAAIVIPVVAVEIGKALHELPAWLAGRYEWVRSFAAERLGVDLTEQLTGGSALEAASQRVQQAVTALAQSALDSVASLLNLVLIPIFTFYFLRDFDTLKTRPLVLVPARYHAEVRDVGREMDTVVGAWLRGQVQVALVLAVFYAVGLGLIGVKLGVFIGILSGLLNVIPYLGVGIGVGLSALMVLIYGQPTQLIGVTALFVVAQLLDDYVIKPRLVGEKVGMGPMTVMVVLLLGGSLFGFFGMILSIPAVAAATVLVRRGLVRYRASDFFNRATDDPDADDEADDGAVADTATGRGADPSVAEDIPDRPAPERRGGDRPDPGDAG